jgi:hypothetical protein
MGRAPARWTPGTVAFGFDLGLSCGYSAVGFGPDGSAELLVSGAWAFGWRNGGGGIQGLMLDKHMSDLVARFRRRQAALAYEIVEFMHRGSHAAKVYYGMLRTLEMAAERMEMPYNGVGVGALKKAVTGHGNSSKDQVALEEHRMFRFPTVKCPKCKRVVEATELGRCPRQVVVKKGTPEERLGTCQGRPRTEDETDAVGAALAIALQLGWWNGTHEA